MKINCSTDGAMLNLLETLTENDKQERLATAISTTEVLSKLNVSIDALPQKCQQHLVQLAKAQAETNIEQLDPIAISFHQSKLISEQMSDEYQILILKQKNEELQAKIDRNNRFLDELRKELESSRSSLLMRSPNPETVQEGIRQLKRQVASYEESCNKTKVKYSKLLVSDNILPKSILSLAETLAKKQEEASQLQARAEDVKLASQARETLSRLMQ